MTNQEVFWRQHIIEHACKRADVNTKGLLRVARLIQSVGHLNENQALNKIARSPEEVKQLAKALQDERGEGDHDEEDVDEGKIEYHDYIDMTYQAPSREPAGVVEYSTFSVPSGER